MVLFPLKNFTVAHFTSLQSKITTQKPRQSTPHHYTSHHFTYLHTTPTSNPLPVSTFLILFLNVFSLQGKDASKPAGNSLQFLMVLFMKEYLPTSVLCFLVLIFRLWPSVLRQHVCRSPSLVLSKQWHLRHSAVFIAVRMSSKNHWEAYLESKLCGLGWRERQRPCVCVCVCVWVSVGGGE